MPLNKTTALVAMAKRLRDELDLALSIINQQQFNRSSSDKAAVSRTTNIICEADILLAEIDEGE